MRKFFSFISLSFFAIFGLATSQIQVPQAQVMMIINPGASVGPDTGAVGTNADLSYQMMSNQTGVGKELLLLQAKEAGETDAPITTGGMLQTDVTSNASSSSITNP